MTTNFGKVSAMNKDFGNPIGNHLDINPEKIRKQCKNILDEFCELQLALGASVSNVELLRLAGTNFKYEGHVDLEGVRDALCDIHVFAYGAHHLMGIDADTDMTSVLDAVMTRFIKNEDDKQATIMKHAAKGVEHVYFEGVFPKMIMKSALDQPDAPKGKFLKSASYKEPVFFKAGKDLPHLPTNQASNVAETAYPLDLAS